MPIEKSPLAAAIESHWTDLGQQSIEVPELVVDGAPVVIHYSPLSLSERDKLNGYGEGGEMVVELLILKAMDAAGEPYFTKADKPQLLTAAADWTQRVANRISSAGSIPVEMLGKL